MANSRIRSVGISLLVVLCLLAIILGGAGLIFLIRQSIMDFSTTNNMDQSVGWELFFWLLFGIPSALFLMAGVAGLVAIRSVSRRSKDEIKNRQEPVQPPPLK